MILLDTDHLSILINASASSHGILLERIEAAYTDAYGIPVVAAEEQSRGWLALIARHKDVEKQVVAYENFAKLLEFLGSWKIVRFDARSAESFKSLRKQLRRLGTQDLKIAAIALANDALLLSANLRDYQQDPGLKVEDWLS
jgi:tRNA(fMet)-specific endonuclease VapC